MSVYVTKSFMPKYDEYEKYLKQIWDRRVLTNQGPCVQELEKTLSQYLEVPYFHYVTNGTIALQLALSSLGIDSGEVITTPFSYVATTSSILWQRCTPVFVDIESNNFTIDVNKIEAAITPNTRAILAVHVFGYACDIEKIEDIAVRHGLKVIYDGAHAFGCKYKGRSLLSYGDVSTCSFHATKVYHTVEGGACVVKDKDVYDRMELQKRFGHHQDEHMALGINGKQSEFHAAMGLALFPYVDNIIRERKRVSDLYTRLLGDFVIRPKEQGDLEYNYAYYPVVFENELQLLQVFEMLEKEQIYARRYFYPSLNTLPYLINKQNCPISEDICSRVACLPLYPELSDVEVAKICNIVLDVIVEKRKFG